MKSSHLHGAYQIRSLLKNLPATYIRPDEQAIAVAQEIHLSLPQFEAQQKPDIQVNERST